jgi:tetratricopeptide (TPR) repeat protein
MRVVLMDFGLAKGRDLELTSSRAGGLLGTLRYAAPEQLAAASLRVGPAADVRGLGVTLWELLTRRRLFAEAEDERQLATMVHDQDVPRLRTVDPGFDRDLEAIVARATERRVADRIATAARLAEYLQLYLDGKTLPIRPPTILELAGRWAHKNGAALGTAAAFLILATILAIATKVASDAQFRRLQADAEAEIERGTVALLNADPTSAQRLLAGALGKIGSESRLRSLGVRAQRVLDQANRRLEEQGKRQRDRRRFDDFMNHYDLALWNGTLFTGRDSGVERARESASEALGLFGLADSRTNTVPLDLSTLQLERREKARIKAGCYELLKLLALLEPANGADVTTTGGRSDAPPNRAGEFRDRASRLIPGLGPGPLASGRAYDALATSAAALQEDADLFTSVDRFLNGLAHYYAHDLKESARQFEGALQVYPDHYWSQYFLALCHLKTGRWSEAKIAVGACLSRKPGSPWPLMLRGYVAGELNDFEAAEADFAAAMNREPDDYGILVNRGAMRLRQGRLAEASDDFRRAIDREPKQYQAYANLAQVYSAQKRWSEAIKQLEQAIERAPAVASLYRSRSRIHLDSGNAAAAQRDLARAIQLAPADPLAHLWRAEEHLANDRYREAVESFDIYERLAVPDAQFYQGRGLARAKLEDYSGAVADYSRSLSLQPNTNVHTRRGWAYTLYPDQLALCDFKEGIKLNDENLEAHVGKGFILARQGKYREATAEAKLVRPLTLPDWQMRINVACIYSLAFDRAKADTGSTDHLALAQRYGEAALALIRTSLEMAADPPSRQSAWQAIAADPALDPLRGLPGFARLEAEFGGRAR